MHRARPFWLGGAACLGIVALLVVVLLFRRSAGSQPGRAGLLQAATGLQARQVGAAQVRLWFRPIPHVTAYLVQVGEDQFYTRAAHLTVSGVLEPDKRYTWWVWGQSQNQRGPQSKPASLRLRPMAARVWQCYPSLLPADQLLLTLYNPTTSASDARVQVTNAVVSQEYVHIPHGSSTEIGVLPTKGGAAGVAMTVKATVPIVVQRVVIKGGMTQSAYGIPKPDAGVT